MNNTSEDGDDRAYETAVWDITLMDDLQSHCHRQFPPEFEELYIDLFSACASGAW